MSGFSFRRGWGLLAVALIGGGIVLGAKLWLGGYVVRSVLRMAGASEIHFANVQANTPGHVVVDDLRFRLGGQQFSAARVVLDREQWFAASLGKVQVERARWAVFLDGSDIDPWSWSRYEGGVDEGVALPFVSLDLEGDLIVRTSGQPDVPLAIRLEGRPRTGVSWTGTLAVDGAGFQLRGEGSLLRAGQELEFRVTEAELDLALWSGQIHRLVVLPGAPWQIAGTLTATAEGRVTAKRFAATAKVALRDGEMKVSRRDIAVRGAEADLEFSDLWKYRTKAAELRLQELRVGRLAVSDVVADFGLWGARTVTVNRATGTALGGRLEVGEFRYYADERDVALALSVRGIAAAPLLALTTGVEAKLTGRFDGELPVRIHGTGVRLETGWLNWRPDGDETDFALNAATLLRSGAAMDAETLQVFRSAGKDPVRLRMEELRLEVRAPGLPLGSSARLRVRGEGNGTPVRFDYLVNGSIERYLEIMP